MATLTQTDLSRVGALFDLPMPLTLRPAVAMSDDEIIAFSHRNKPYRIERNPQGELEITSLLGMDRSHWEAVVIGELHRWAREHGGICFSSTGGFTLADGSMRSPDAAWISQDRYDAISREERRGFARICPEFLIEILSDSDSRAVLEAKMEMWIANGAQLAWLIDPYAATVRVYRADGSIDLLHHPDSVQAEEVVVGFRLITRKLWDE